MHTFKRNRVSQTFPPGTRVKQSFKAECDINNILSKYKATGIITHVKENGQYIDCPSGLDYQEAQNLVLEANQTFSELPAAVRQEFNNDPSQFLAFVENPENVERMQELGLAELPEIEPGPIEVFIKEDKKKEAAKASKTE